MNQTAAATPNAEGNRFAGWFRRAAKSSIDALPMHLPVRLGGADIAQIFWQDHGAARHQRPGACGRQQGEACPR